MSVHDNGPARLKDHKLQTGMGVAGVWLSAGLIISVCLFIVCYVFIEGAGSLSWRFLITEPNLSAIRTDSGGILTPMAGTVFLTVISIVLVFPFALATSVYLCFYAKRGVMKTLVSTAIDILSGVPTIVIGLFALSIFTLPGFAFISKGVEGVEGMNRAYGKSFLVCGISMAIMILPFVIKSMEEALRAVPESYYEGALALGASKWRAISKTVLGAAKQGIVTGIILGMGRVVGDTAIVWLTLGGTLRMTGLQPWYLHPLSTLRSTGSTLTSYIFFTSPAGEGNNYRVAFGASLVLIGIILVLNIATALIGKSKKYV